MNKQLICCSDKISLQADIKRLEKGLRMIAGSYLHARENPAGFHEAVVSGDHRTCAMIAKQTLNGIYHE